MTIKLTDQGKFDHPHNLAEATIEAHKLRLEAVDAFYDQAVHDKIKGKLTSMTTDEQQLMGQAFRNIATSNEIGANTCLPEVEVARENGEFRSLTFTGSCKDEGHSMTFSVTPESEQKKMARYEQGAEEIALQIKNGIHRNYGRIPDEAMQRIEFDKGHMSDQHWIYMLKRISELAPKNVKYITPDQIAKMSAEQKTDLVKMSPQASLTGGTYVVMNDDGLFRTGLLTQRDLLAYSIPGTTEDNTWWISFGGIGAPPGHSYIEDDYDEKRLSH